MRTRLVLAALSAAAGAHAAPAAPQMMQGGNLFTITCSSSFCHGDGGVGARGPSLRNRNFTPDFVRNTVVNGRSGTPMPAFKATISTAELDMIVAYVMSLSPDNHAADSAAVAPAAPAARAPAPLRAQARAGSALFFDAARPASCALCHSYGGNGGPVGPDLDAVARRAPRDIYHCMVRPAAASSGYPAATVVTPDGASVSGILKQKTDAVIRLYDLSSVPPVLRSFYPADGARLAAPAAVAPYAHDLSGYSKEELASLIAFLKSADGAAKDVSPQDVVQP